MYRLSCTLAGHTGDVRAAVEMSPAQILTGSRDRTAKLWTHTAPNAFEHTATFEAHSNYVMSLAFLPPDEAFPQGLIATGSLDKSIMLWDPTVCAGPIKQLTEHQGAVCCLDADPSSTGFVSSSWDSTARVWTRSGECKATLAGHTQSVIAVKCHPFMHGVVLTGSADRTIRLWKDGISVITFTGHTDAVRGLAILSDREFVSCANDATVRMWSFDGAALGEFYGHQAYIYSICTIPSLPGMFATSGEDGCVKVWRSDSPDAVQTIDLPCVSVWHVAARHNGDLIVCADDSLTRVFTARDEALASAEDLVAFDELVSAHLASKNADSVGAIKKSDLPDKSVLQYPGRKEGDHKLVNNRGKVEAYTWSMSKAQWEFAGEVTHAVNPDYTFTIELDGKNMKLEYNKGENPYEVAQKFIHKHDLSQFHLDEIAQFITKNAETPTLEFGAPRRNPDPFTGGGAYVPGSGGGGTGYRGDPFTGGGAYRTTDPKPPQKKPTSGATPASGGAAASSAYRGDPFTGGAAYVTPATRATPQAQAQPAPAHFPNTTILTIGGGKAEGILKKVREFNAAQAEHGRLTAQELAMLEKGVGAAIANTDMPAVEVLTFTQGLAKVLGWSKDQIFPGLDILRLAVLWQPFVTAVTALPVPVLFTPDHLLPFAIEAAGLGATPAASAANQMLAWRTIANSFFAQDVFGPLRFIAPVCTGLTHVNVSELSAAGQLAVSTALLNFVSAVRVGGGSAEDEFEALKGLDALLASRPQDPEAAYRALVAAGSLISGSDVLVAAAQTLSDFVRAVEAYRAHATPKVAECAAAISDLFV